MKKAGLIGTIILLTGVITFYLLMHKPADSVFLVKLKGVGYIMNITKSHLDAATFSVKDDIVVVPACKNDILYCLPSDSKKDYSFIQQVKQQTDEMATIVFDSIGCHIDGRLVSLNLPSASAWLSTCTRQDIRYLQSVNVSDSLTENVIQEFKRIGIFPSDIGLLIDSSSGYLNELQGVLKPTWIWIGSTKLSSRELDEWNKIRPIESMVLNGGWDQIKLDEFKKLNRLLLIDLDSISLKRLDQLPQGISSIHINDSKITDLDFLKSNAQLKELTFTDCNLLNNIGALTKLPHLKILSLSNCDSIQDLNPLAGLKELAWFAPPKNISEQQLASIVKNSPDIESLELINCKNIKSLHMLKGLHKLAYLRVQQTHIAEDSLFSFQKLKYLAYGNKDSNDTLSVAKLESKLPHTTVMASQPFCMGTGWLILFFGLVVLLAVMAVKVKSKVGV